MLHIITEEKLSWHHIYIYVEGLDSVANLTNDFGQRSSINLKPEILRQI